MKKLLVAGAALAALGTPALAADMALKAPPVPALAATTWSGWYAGVNAGYSLNQVTTTTSAGCPAGGYFCSAGGAAAGFANVAAINADGSGSFHSDAFTGGVQAGYNWQSGNLVLGVESDVEAYRTKVTTSVAQAYTGAPAVTFVEGTAVSTNWLSTSRIRAGLASDKVLVYATGGLALSDLTVSDTFSDNLAPGALGGSSSGATQLKAGWTVGAGLEYALSRNWSVRGEYLYVNLGSVSTTSTVSNPGFATTPNPLTITSKLTGNIARAALNYRF